MVKLGKLTKAGTVYRGLSGGTLPEEFWQANDYGVCGGCEYAFMSTTLDKDVAFSYAGSKVATILEIRMGMVDRGADVSWLSQYPGEKEYCAEPPHAQRSASAATPCCLRSCTERARTATVRVLQDPLRTAHGLGGGRQARRGRGDCGRGAAQREPHGAHDRAGDRQDERARTLTDPGCPTDCD